MIPNEENNWPDFDDFFRFVLKMLFMFVAFTVIFLTLSCQEPYKPRAKQLCRRSHTIEKPQPKQGKLFEKPIRFYEMPRYKYKSGYPTLGIDYLIIRL